MLMTPIKTDDATALAAVPPREFLSTLVWIKADGRATAGTQSLIEILAPNGWATPWHMTGDRDFAKFVREMSTPAVGNDLPAPSEPDLEKVVSLAARYGMEILGPMPD